jgi:hypothetical protein
MPETWQVLHCGAGSITQPHRYSSHMVEHRVVRSSDGRISPGLHSRQQSGRSTASHADRRQCARRPRDGPDHAVRQARCGYLATGSLARTAAKAHRGQESHAPRRLHVHGRIRSGPRGFTSQPAPGTVTASPRDADGLADLLWVPKTCAIWVDARGTPSARSRTVPGGRAGAGWRAMIFGLWA